MFAMADSASMRCARVMRGMASMASTVTLRAAMRSMRSLFWAGQKKLMSAAPGLMKSDSCTVVPGRNMGWRTLRMTSDSTHTASELSAIVAPADT